MGKDRRIIVDEDYTLGKGKKGWENFVLEKEENFLKIYKKKIWENCVLKKEKWLRKFWTWKPENVIAILRKFYTWKKLSKSKVRQKKF